MGFEALDTLLDRLAEAAEPDAVLAGVDQFAKAIGFEWVTLFLPLKSGPLVLSSYPPEWMERYLAADFYAVDPVASPSNTMPVTWKEPEGATGKVRQLFQEAAAWGITSGAMGVARSADGMMFYSFAGRVPGSEIDAFFDRRRQQLVVLATAYGLERLLELRASVPDVRLSSREVECLKWAAIGKSQGQAAHEMGITPRTVAFHMENAKKKLGVKTMRQAVAAAISLGFLPAAAV